jgi:IstB-like ATP binding protein
MSQCLHWSALADGYYQGFSTKQNRLSKDARLVIGAVIIKHRRCLSDEDAVAQIQEKSLPAVFRAVAKGDGQYHKLLATLAKTQVMTLDDRGQANLTAWQHRDLLEILEDRYASRSTLATSQLPVEKWHDLMGDATLADAILDRVVHNAYKINLKEGSMRKCNAKLTRTTQPG